MPVRSHAMIRATMIFCEAVLRGCSGNQLPNYQVLKNEIEEKLRSHPGLEGIVVVAPAMGPINCSIVNPTNTEEAQPAGLAPEGNRDSERPGDVQSTFIPTFPNLNPHLLRPAPMQKVLRALIQRDSRKLMIIQGLEGSGKTHLLIKLRDYVTFRNLAKYTIFVQSVNNGTLGWQVTSSVSRTNRVDCWDAESVINEVNALIDRTATNQQPDVPDFLVLIDDCPPNCWSRIESLQFSRTVKWVVSNRGAISQPSATSNRKSDRSRAGPQPVTTHNILELDMWNKWESPWNSKLLAFCCGRCLGSRQPKMKEYWEDLKHLDSAGWRVDNSEESER
eukprot:c18923_g1_i3.p1 GENE.c18923_g1_i3~~c18923_g1_i3.p1  ORF type:complete len:334 (+),score=47.11 c18923_g1_i3:1309-2310(+)